MAGVLVYSDKLNLGLELLTAAKSISDNVKAVAINNEELAQGLSAAGAQVLKVDNASLNIADTSLLASALQQIAEKEDISVVLLSSNRRGKELAGSTGSKNRCRLFN